MECSVGDPAKPEELSYDGMVMTAMRIVNAIPYVCAAPPGIATFLDLPLTTPSSAFRSEATFIDHKISKPVR
jgi:2,4-diaminopentanoate dehydrogenase